MQEYFWVENRIPLMAVSNEYGPNFGYIEASSPEEAVAKRKAVYTEQNYYPRDIAVYRCADDYHKGRPALVEMEREQLFAIIPA